MDSNFKYVLLTVLTLSVFVLTIIELTGISRNAVIRRYKDGGDGVFVSRDGERYHGEIFPEQTRTRTEIVARMAKTTIQFYETKYRFTPVQQGKVITHTFKFKNTGSNQLMIAKADVSCGCTVASFTLDSIPPSGYGEVSIVFNSANMSGFQQKNIMIHSNALPEAVPVTIEGEVIK